MKPSTIMVALLDLDNTVNNQDEIKHFLGLAKSKKITFVPIQIGDVAPVFWDGYSPDNYKGMKYVGHLDNPKTIGPFLLNVFLFVRPVLFDHNHVIVYHSSGFSEQVKTLYALLEGYIDENLVLTCWDRISIETLEIML